MASDSIVIIPTYNEKENIEKMIRKVFSLQKDFHLLIIDDNSPDGTADIIKNLQQEFPESLHLEQRAGKLGLGTAYIHGFRWALKRDYQFIYEMDADFSHNPEDLERLYKAAKESGGLAVGSRYTKGGKVENWPMGRILMSYGASIYVRSVLWVSFKDATAGFMCYSRQVLEAINLDDMNFKGYAFQIAMKYAAHKLGFKVVEVPITFKDRILGTSKMNTSIFKEAMLGVLNMRLHKYGQK